MNGTCAVCWGDMGPAPQPRVQTEFKATSEPAAEPSRDPRRLQPSPAEVLPSQDQPKPYYLGFT